MASLWDTQTSQTSAGSGGPRRPGGGGGRTKKKRGGRWEGGWYPAQQEAPLAPQGSPGKWNGMAPLAPLAPLAMRPAQEQRWGDEGSSPGRMMHAPRPVRPHEARNPRISPPLSSGTDRSLPSSPSGKSPSRPQFAPTPPPDECNAAWEPSTPISHPAGTPVSFAPASPSAPPTPHSYGQPSAPQTPSHGFAAFAALPCTPTQAPQWGPGEQLQQPGLEPSHYGWQEPAFPRPGLRAAAPAFQPRSLPQEHALLPAPRGELSYHDGQLTFHGQQPVSQPVYAQPGGWQEFQQPDPAYGQQFAAQSPTSGMYHAMRPQADFAARPPGGGEYLQPVPFRPEPAIPLQPDLATKLALRAQSMGDDATSATEPGTTEASQVAASGSSSQVGDRVSPVEGVYDRALAEFSSDAVLQVCRAPGPEHLVELARAVHGAAAADPGQARRLAELLAAVAPRLPAFPPQGEKGEPLTALRELLRLCSADINAADHGPKERVHGSVILSAELYGRNLVPMGAMKDMFQHLLFRGSPPEPLVRWSCAALLVAGPRLDRNEVGQKMVEFVVLRLQELRAGKYSAAARTAMHEVEQIRANNWVQKLKGGRKERPRGNSKDSDEMGTPSRSSGTSKEGFPKGSSKDSAPPRAKRFPQESFEYSSPKQPAGVPADGSFRAAAQERGSILPAPNAG